MVIYRRHISWACFSEKTIWNPWNEVFNYKNRCVSNFFIENVLSDGTAKFPTASNDNVSIQQNSTIPHMSTNDVKFVQDTQELGWNMQPAGYHSNSPD